VALSWALILFAAWLAPGVLVGLALLWTAWLRPMLRGERRDADALPKHDAAAQPVVRMRGPTL